MDAYFFNEDHQLFRQSLKDFLGQEVIPYIDEWEEKRKIPRQMYKRFGEMGYFGLLFPEKYGGLELDFFYAVVMLEEMAKVNSGGFSAALQAHSFLALQHIAAEGNDAQKQTYLAPGIAGEIFGCLAITEAGGGSDVASISTSATKTADGYVLNGSKTFITNGVESDFLIVAAKTDTKAGANGISMFIVDRDTKGISAQNIEKLGWHASDTGEISFDQVPVPHEHLLGEENQGFFYIMHHFAMERLVMAVGAIASAEFALKKALEYMNQREAFGRKLNRFQVLRHDIAQMASEIEALKIFNYDLCQRYEQGAYIVKEAAMAKLLSTELALSVSDKCLQMFGGYGFTEEFPMARLYRDNRLGPIGGGSSEIMCEIIAKMVIDDKAYDSALNASAQDTNPGLIQFSEEHQIFRQSLHDFFKKEAEPYIAQWEADRRTPRDIWLKMGEMGFLGLNYPEKYGGLGLDFYYDIIFNEELGRLNSGGFAICQQVVQYMSSPYILKYGSEKLREKYLPGIISGEKIACIGITEPGAGSDAANIKTKAIREGEFYLVNGSKTFITNGVYGDFIITVVKTNPELGAAGVSLLVIDRNAEGVSARKIKKLGWWCSDTAELSFDNVRVPVENLIGEEGKGFYYLMNGLQLERLSPLPAAIVGMETAISLSLKYMSERKAFGRSIDRFQVLRHRIARMVAEVTALKSFVYHCCRIYADNHYDVKLCSMAKLLVTEKTNEVANKCLQFYGGYGFTEAFPMARFYRDCRVGTIGAGSSQIMRNIIAKIVIDEVDYEAAPSAYKAPAPGKQTSKSSSDQPINFDTILSQVQKRAEQKSGMGRTIKFDFGDQQLFLNGKGEKNEVTQSNDAAECTINIALNDFNAMLKGKLDPMQAMMTGKLTIEGDMGAAMKLQSIFS